MKDYKALNMIAASRYKRYIGTLSEAEQQTLRDRLQALVEENRDYCDKGNYTHLSNILTTIALDELLQSGGKTPDEAFEIISTHMWAALEPTRRAMQRLARLPFFMPLMRKVVPLGFRHGSGKGWRYTWLPQRNRNIFEFECNECLYKTIFSKYGLLERFGPMFCHSDIINYGELPYTNFRRTQTLCQGGDKCDFCFVRHTN